MTGIYENIGTAGFTAFGFVLTIIAFRAWHHARPHPVLLLASGFELPGAGPPRGKGVLARLLVSVACAGEGKLALEDRRRIYERVEQGPGAHVGEIARERDLASDRVEDHLEILELHGIVTSSRRNGDRRFFAITGSPVGRRDVLDRKERDMLGVLRREVPLNATLILLDEGEATVSNLADTMGVAASILAYHLNRMEDAGLVASRGNGREREYLVQDPGLVMDLLVREEPPDELVKGFLDAWEQLEIGWKGLARV